MTSLHEILESVQYELEIISMVTDDAGSIMVGKTIETMRVTAIIPGKASLATTRLKPFL